MGRAKGITSQGAGTQPGVHPGPLQGPEVPGGQLPSGTGPRSKAAGQPQGREVPTSVTCWHP